MWDSDGYQVGGGRRTNPTLRSSHAILSIVTSLCSERPPETRAKRPQILDGDRVPDLIHCGVLPSSYQHLNQ